MAYAVSGGACVYSPAATLMGLALKPENPSSGQGLCGESAGSGSEAESEAGPERFRQKCLRSKKRLKMTRMYYVFAHVLNSSATFHSLLI